MNLRQSKRLVIAGASSLLGAELKTLLEESIFADWDFRLVDEASVSGLLTEAGGEPALIQPVEEDSFAHARLIFFTGSAEFTGVNLRAALASGAKVLDLSGMRADREASCPWFPQLPGKALDFSPNGNLFSVLSAPAVCSALLSLALKSVGLKRMDVTHYQSVSEAGRAGIDELEGQTSQLLSFQPVGKGVFGAQVAYTMLNRFGGESRRDLPKDLEKVRSQVAQALGAFGVVPSLMLLHAPVFYGAAFSANADVDPASSSENIVAACESAGFRIAREKDELVGNLSPAGESFLHLAEPQPDSAAPGTWWFWGAADNIRLPAWNAVKLAEKLLA